MLEMWFFQKSQKVWFREKQRIIFENRNRLRSSKERTRILIYTEWSRRKEKECEISHFASREKNFFFNFPSHMKKNHEKMKFYLLKWAKSVIFVGREEILFPLPTAGNNSKKFPFPHEGREIFLGDFPSRMWEGKRLSSHFPSQWPPWIYEKKNLFYSY